MAPKATAVSTHWSVERLVGLKEEAGMHLPLEPTQLCSMEDHGSTEKCMNWARPTSSIMRSCEALGATAAQSAGASSSSGSSAGAGLVILLAILRACYSVTDDARGRRREQPGPKFARSIMRSSGHCHEDF